MKLISASDFLAHENARLLDVRAEVEFQHGHLPASINLPILHDEERRQVGTCYKHQGQAAAIALGHALVDPTRVERVAAWRAHLEKEDFPVLACWRGGLRSETTQRWLAESGFASARVQGGYKAIRHLLLEAIEAPLAGYVLTGLTGTGKTRLLRDLQIPRVLDLERLACHRGSAFGGLFEPPPPAQQTFENALGLALYRAAGRPLLIEDESRLVGRLVLPKPFFTQMSTLPRILLELGVEERVENLLEEYVREPLRTLAPEVVRDRLVGALQSLRSRLGGLATQELEAAVRLAFATGKEERHRDWLARLLRDYYDPLYTHAFQRGGAALLQFRGQPDEVRAWLEKNLPAGI